MGVAVQEFDRRAGEYLAAFASCPFARQMDRERILSWLCPLQDETVVDIASGNGYLALGIAPHCKKVYVADISERQLENFPKLKIILTEHPENIETILTNVNIPLPDSSVDAIYTCGGFHHVKDHHNLLGDCHRILKVNGRLLVCDVAEGSSLAKHFDAFVTRYCKTGHHRSWINPAYFSSLCYRAGFAEPKVKREVIDWTFDRESDIGMFFKFLHGLECSSEKTLEHVKNHFEIENHDGKYHLKWPLLFAFTRKLEVK